MKNKTVAALTPDQMAIFRADINAALAAVAKKHNLDRLGLAAGTYDPAGVFSFKVEGRIGGALEREQLRYDNSGHLMNLPPRGTRFTFKSHEYVTYGLTTRMNGYVLCHCTDDGKIYKIPVDAVKGQS